jgi:hypothetical protein
MPSSPDVPTTLASALELLSRVLQAWDPDKNPDVKPALEALRAVQLRFDPRKDRLSASLCVTSMKLLELIAARGQIGPAAAVAVVGELTQGLRESLEASTASPAVRPGSHRNMINLQPSDKPGGLSLAVGSVKSQQIGELMVRMNMLTQEQVDRILAVQAESVARKHFGEIAIELGYASEWTVNNALRLQQRGRGETPMAPASGGDPWGNSPL